MQPGGVRPGEVGLREDAAGLKAEIGHAWPRIGHLSAELSEVDAAWRGCRVGLVGCGGNSYPGYSSGRS